MTMNFDSIGKVRDPCETMCDPVCLLSILFGEHIRVGSGEFRLGVIHTLRPLADGFESVRIAKSSMISSQDVAERDEALRDTWAGTSFMEHEKRVQSIRPDLHSLLCVHL